MKKYIIGLLLFIFCSSLSFGQSWLWVKQCGHSGPFATSDPASIITDKAGNIYQTGGYTDTVSFGTYTFKCKAQRGDCFLVKYDPNGNVIWAKSSESRPISGAESFFSAIDKMGNVYITGLFFDTTSFGAITLTNGSANGNVFIAKYDSNGNVLWAKSPNMGFSNNYSRSYSAATDDSDNVYITGAFYDSIKFGSYTLLNSSLNYSNTNTFLAKYDSSGNVVWATCPSVKQSSSSYGQGITTDHLNNVYIIGNFNGSISFDTVNMVEQTLGQDIFIVKYASDGIQKWTKMGYLPSKTSYVPPNQLEHNFEYLTVDNSGNIYATGTFVDSIGFDSILLHIDTNAQYSAFLLKFSPNGNIIWGKNSSYGGVAYCLSVDKCDNIYWAGDCGASPFSLGSFKLYPDIKNYLVPACLIKLDSNGNGKCGTIIYNSNDDWDPIATDPTGNNVYFSGDGESVPYIIFGSDTIFDNPNLETGFFAKWQSCSNNSCYIETNIEQTKKISEPISLFPNPNNGQFTIDMVGETPCMASLQVYNMMGQKIFAETLQPQTPVRNSTGGPKGALNEINIGNQPNGVYLYRVTNETGVLLGSGKFIIQK